MRKLKKAISFYQCQIRKMMKEKSVSFDHRNPQLKYI